MVQEMLKDISKKNIILAVFLIFICALVVVALVFKKANANLDALAQKPLARINLLAVKDGTYAGSYKAFPVSAVVEVTVEDHKITCIEVIRHSYGEDGPIETMAERVLEAQSLRVDLVTGATFSTKAILVATEDALKAALKEALKKKE